MDYIRNFFVNLARSWTTWISGFLPDWGVDLVNYLIVGIILVLMPVLATLTLTWMERKVIGRIQNRIGPNRVGPFGIFQAIADAVKMLIKEDIVPSGADKPVFNLAPILIAGAAALLWAVVPFGRGMIGQNLNIGALYVVAVGSITTIAVIMAGWSSNNKFALLWAVVPFGRGMIGQNLNIGALYVVAVGSITTIAVIMAGWSSNNKFALLGAFRVVAQLLSYEVPMVLSIAAVVLVTSTMRMGDIVERQVVPFIFVLPVAFITYLLAAAAETGRAPFDLLEADSEIVAGYFVEYSGLKFGWFYIAEYGNLFAISAITTTLFLGGWRGPFASVAPVLGPLYFIIKTLAVIFLLMWIRGTWPRFRIDQMLAFAWKVLVPASLANLLWSAIVLQVGRQPEQVGPNLVQMILLLVGNVAIIAVAGLLLGRAARRYAAQHGWATA